MIVSSHWFELSLLGFSGSDGSCDMASEKLFVVGFSGNDGICDKASEKLFIVLLSFCVLTVSEDSPSMFSGSDDSCDMAEVSLFIVLFSLFTSLLSEDSPPVSTLLLFSVWFTGSLKLIAIAMAIWSSSVRALNKTSRWITLFESEFSSVLLE